MDGIGPIVQCMRDSDSRERAVHDCAEGFLEQLERAEENELFIPGGADIYAMVTSVSANRGTQLSVLRSALGALVKWYKLKEDQPASSEVDVAQSDQLAAA